jgi:hypothetical protein
MRATKATRAAVEERRAQWERDQDEREWQRMEAAPQPAEFYGPSVVQRPHPRSYGAHLPLHPQNFRDMTRTTAEERALLKARPLLVNRTDIDQRIEERAREMQAKAGPDYWRNLARKELSDTVRAHAKLADRAPELTMIFC